MMDLVESSAPVPGKNSDRSWFSFLQITAFQNAQTAPVVVQARAQAQAIPTAQALPAVRAPPVLVLLHHRVLTRHHPHPPQALHPPVKKEPMVVVILRSQAHVHWRKEECAAPAFSVPEPIASLAIALLRHYQHPAWDLSARENVLYF